MTRPPDTGMTPGQRHIGALAGALTVLDTRLLDDWGRRLAVALRRGGRLLVAGSGGSAAQEAHQVALHLICLAFDTAEPDPEAPRQRT